MPLTPAQGRHRRRQMNLCELQASFVYVVPSQPGLHCMALSQIIKCVLVFQQRRQNVTLPCQLGTQPVTYRNGFGDSGTPFHLPLSNLRMPVSQQHLPRNPGVPLSKPTARVAPFCR